MSTTKQFAIGCSRINSATVKGAPKTKLCEMCQTANIPAAQGRQRVCKPCLPEWTSLQGRIRKANLKAKKEQNH